MAKRTIEWTKLTIAEPFPVFPKGFPGHDEPYTGPYYAAGSTWFFLPTERAHAEACAAARRAEGFTATLTTEVR